jgi:uncharacterized protein
VTIVSNTSPITNLAAIAHLDLLHYLYGKIVIPQAVYAELTEVGYPVPGSTEVQNSDWIEVRQISDRAQVEQFRQVVDAGESEAIALALELSAERLLIDEATGRAIAQSLGLRITGILGVLLIAKQRKLIPIVKPLLDELIQQAGFRVSPGLYDAVLKTASE